MAYDLEERTYLFARSVRDFVKRVKKTISNKEDIKQVARSSGSIAANYIEVNDCLGPKDQLMKLRICKKEAKESILWLRLMDVSAEQENEREKLVLEATELKKIIASIYHKLLTKSNG